MQCDTMRQVCAYRCITSYETETMEKFSLCVLQKHNCMCNSAEIPTLPDPAPQTKFRGEALTHESAQDLFIGWLGKEAYSWKVVSEVVSVCTIWIAGNCLMLSSILFVGTGEVHTVLVWFLESGEMQEMNFSTESE